MLNKNRTERRHGWTNEVEKRRWNTCFCFFDFILGFHFFPIHLKNVNYRLLSKPESFYYFEKKKNISVLSSLVFLLFSFLNQFELKFLFGITFLTVFTYNNHRLLSPKTERNFHKKEGETWMLIIVPGRKSTGSQRARWYSNRENTKNTCCIFFSSFPPIPQGFLLLYNILLGLFDKNEMSRLCQGKYRHNIWCYYSPAFIYNIWISNFVFFYSQRTK